jgi:hypothetical protein
VHEKGITEGRGDPDDESRRTLALRTKPQAPAMP